MGKFATEYPSATKIKHPDECFIFVVIGIGLDTATKLPGSEQAHTARAVKGARERSSWELQSLTIRQYSGMYADTDKKPAVPRDFLCIEFGVPRKALFLGGKIPLSIQCLSFDSQLYTKY